MSDGIEKMIDKNKLIIKMSEIAAELAPKPKIVHSMENIMKLPVEKGNDWNVYAYTINKDIIDEEGNVEDLRALVFPLGSFYNFEEADKHAKTVMEKTQHPHIVVGRYGLPIKITSKPDTALVETVTVDLKGRIMKMESAEYREQMIEYEKKFQLESDMIKETELEMDVENLEHYKRYAYLCVKNYTMALELKKKSDEMFIEFYKNQKILKQHLIKHPEHEEAFLPFFKEKLLSRGEEELYLRISSAYTKYKDIILS